MSSSRVLLPARRLFVEPGGRSRAGAIPEAVPGKYLAVNATIPGLATCCRNPEKDPQRFRRQADSCSQWGLGGRAVGSRRQAGGEVRVELVARRKTRGG